MQRCLQEHRRWCNNAMRCDVPMVTKFMIPLSRVVPTIITLHYGPGHFNHILLPLLRCQKVTSYRSAIASGTNFVQSECHRNTLHLGELDCCIVVQFGGFRLRTFEFPNALISAMRSNEISALRISRCNVSSMSSEWFGIPLNYVCSQLHTGQQLVW